MQLLNQGFVLLFVGMAVVYVFLILLCYVMGLAAKVMPKFSYMLPDPVPAGSNNGKNGKNGSGAADVEVAIAVAMAAKAAAK